LSQIAVGFKKHSTGYFLFLNARVEEIPVLTGVDCWQIRQIKSNLRVF
jgi:hypothetical protein